MSEMIGESQVEWFIPETFEILMNPPRILLAEDDDSLRILIAELLQDCGYEVVEACDGAQILEHLQNKNSSYVKVRFDLVISDVRMPLITGMEVLSKVQSEVQKVPFILITAFGSPSLHAEAKLLGAVAVLDKPFELDDLKNIVEKIVPPLPLG